LGQYILDFYCVRAKLAVEVDGIVHGFDHKMASDARRDAWLGTLGIDVYRLNAADVFADPDAAADGAIQMALERLGRSDNLP